MCFRKLSRTSERLGELTLQNLVAGIQLQHVLIFFRRFAIAAQSVVGLRRLKKDLPLIARAVKDALVDLKGFQRSGCLVEARKVILCFYVVGIDLNNPLEFPHCKVGLVGVQIDRGKILMVQYVERVASNCLRSVLHREPKLPQRRVIFRDSIVRGSLRIELKRFLVLQDGIRVIPGDVIHRALHETRKRLITLEFLETVTKLGVLFCLRGQLGGLLHGATSNQANGESDNQRKDGSFHRVIENISIMTLNNKVDPAAGVEWGLEGGIERSYLAIR